MIVKTFPSALLMLFLLFAFNSCKKPLNKEQEVVPINPTELTVNLVSTTQATLNWVDKSTNEAGFKVERKTGSGAFGVIATTATNITTINDAGLTPNTTYTYRVYSFNNTGNSLSYTNEVTITTIALATVTTTAISDTTGVSAISGGNITNDGSSPVTARGIVWSTSSSPTISLATKTSDGSGTGQFSSRMEGLSKNTKYFVRAYATNAAGTAYGNELSFTTNTVELNAGLVAHYPFNGNANDESGNGNNGTVNSAILTTDRFGIANRAYLFNAEHTITGSSTKFPASNSARSISFWFQSSAIGILAPSVESMHVMGYGGGICGQSFIMNFTNTFLEVQGHCANFITRGTLNYTTPNSNWHHVVVTFNGNTLKIYMDGIFIQERQGITMNTNTVSKIFCFGRQVDNPGSGILNTIIPQKPFNGKLDDFYIHNRVLSQEEISYMSRN
jgi:hypothetical protein